MVEELNNTQETSGGASPIDSSFADLENYQPEGAERVENKEKAQFMAESIAQDMDDASNEKRVAKKLAEALEDPDFEFHYNTQHSSDPGIKRAVFGLAREKAGINESLTDGAAQREIEREIDRSGEEFRVTPRELLAHAKKATEEAYAKADEAGRRYEALQSFLAEFDES